MAGLCGASRSSEHGMYDGWVEAFEEHAAVCSAKQCQLSGLSRGLST